MAMSSSSKDGYAPLPLGRGGLRPNHTGASDADSKRLDSNLKTIRDELAEELVGVPGLQMKVRIPKTDTITPCEPDGGAWYYNGILIAAFEAKKQQDAGNAIERWYKNMHRCRVLNPDISYVTFCRGEGARPRGVIGIALEVAHPDGWNKYHPGRNSCWLEPQGFTKEFIKGTMREVLMERLRHYGYDASGE
jgi:hypothetical protein